MAKMSAEQGYLSQCNLGRMQIRHSDIDHGLWDNGSPNEAYEATRCPSIGILCKIAFSSMRLSLRENLCL